MYGVYGEYIGTTGSWPKDGKAYGKENEKLDANWGYSSCLGKLSPIL